jgi:hypothetical protein
MIIQDWARRWGIPDYALLDLMNTIAAVGHPEGVGGEAVAQTEVRVEAATRGARLFRNNSGVAFDESGRPVRFGLGNDSKQVNAVMKSSDLIGIWPHTVTPGDVGRQLGVFTAIEMKRPGWKYRGTQREVAQSNFLALVTALGGIGKFITRVEDL